MKLFSCQTCGQVLSYENTVCERCHSRLGYLSDSNELSSLYQDGPQTSGAGWLAWAAPGETFRFCANAAHDVCNWLLPAGAAGPFCRACQHNRTIPDLGVPGNLIAWRKLEVAKHRLFYGYLRLKLDAPTRLEDPEHGLVFDFLADTQAGKPVLTGHDEGEIVLALSEADDAERERRRAQMGEPYRTLLGHFRHETGHYFWDVLVRNGRRLQAARKVFGNEEADYGEALKRHYRQGAPPDWKDRYVSAYASTHPWEDFAETWAHYLHIVDTLEMAVAFGMQLQPRAETMVETRVVAGAGPGVEPGVEQAVPTRFDLDPYAPGPLQPLIDRWLPLTFAVNSLNRCMGAPDLYPFVLAPAALGKLAFIHALVHGEIPQDAN